MYIGQTEEFTFTINDPALTDLNDALNIVAYVNVNNIARLKFKRGGGVGYDGDIVIDGTNLLKCYVRVTREKSLLLKTGRLETEAMVQIADVNYNPDGRFIVVRVPLEPVNASLTVGE